MANMKRTSLNLDKDIVKEAKEIFFGEYKEYVTTSLLIRRILFDFVEKHKLLKDTKKALTKAE